MFKEIIFTLLLAGCVVAFPQPENASELIERKGRIVGGRDATIEEFPFMAALFYNARHYCGGAILNANTIVSAAHCTDGYPPAGFTIRVGSNRLATGGQLVQVARTIEHELYRKSPSMINDIVILKLQRNLVMSAQVRAIALPELASSVPHGTMASVTGWGGTNTQGNLNPTVMQTLNTQVIGNAQCTTLNNFQTRIDQLCAGAVVGRDTCYRDEGNPLVSNGRLIGVVSWGFGPGCAVGRPIVYTRISQFLPFITRNM